MCTRGGGVAACPPVEDSRVRPVLAASRRPSGTSPRRSRAGAGLPGAVGRVVVDDVEVLVAEEARVVVDPGRDDLMRSAFALGDASQSMAFCQRRAN